MLTVVIIPNSIPKERFKTFARGARQLVWRAPISTTLQLDRLLLTVQLAFETTDIEESYSFRFTPTTIVLASLHAKLLKNDLIWDMIKKPTLKVQKLQPSSPHS